MSRSLRTLALVFFSISCLIGCGGSESSVPVAPTPPKPAPPKATGGGGWNQIASEETAAPETKAGVWGSAASESSAESSESPTASKNATTASFSGSFDSSNPNLITGEFFQQPGAGTLEFELPEEANSEEMAFLKRPDGRVDTALGWDLSQVKLTPRPSQTLAPPKGLEAIPGTEYHESGYPKYVRCLLDRSIMVLVPPAIFVRGSAEISNASPVHEIELSGFYIDQTEVTLREFRLYESAAKGEGKRFHPALNQDDPDSYPALGIRYRDAFQYCERVGKRLPTEAEWELAARGSQSLPHVWGVGPPLWSRPRRPGDVDEPKSYPHDRSVYDVYDLAGNAREWCADYYSETAYQDAASLPPESRKDWQGPRRTRERVVRGEAEGWSVIARTGMSPVAPEPTVGFRGVVSLPDRKSPAGLASRGR